jgi:DNA-directed RNA polymerase specialized sigma24 family protein
MTSLGSVSAWVRELQTGDRDAAQKLWERCFQKLVRLARAKLRDTPRAAADEEDVALSAFDSFFRGAKHGRFPQLTDRHDLWRLLVAITERKAVDLARHERRQKRTGSAVNPSARAGAVSADAAEAHLEQLAALEPTPEFAAQVADECERLLRSLENAGLRSVALWKMEGYTNAEIAEKLGCGLRSVERKLRLIRSILEREMAP